MLGFSIMKTMPLVLQPTLYNGGRYNSTKNVKTDIAAQVRSSMSVSEGMSNRFMPHYAVLENLNRITQITDNEDSTFLFLSNKLPHEPMLLQTPDYIPAKYVDNREYDAQHTDRFTADGKTLKINNAEEMASYHSNMSALLRLGDWFDYLREQGVYDNTRIILVADHGWDLGHEEMIVGDDRNGFVNADCYYPLLMVKDFDSHGFTVSDEFMTNADVPTLAMQELIESPVNPFTGKSINSDEKYAHDQIIIVSNDWRIHVNNGNTYLPAAWLSVHDDILDKDNWNYYNVESVLTEHVLP